MDKSGFSRRTFFKGTMAVATLWIFNAWNQVVKTEMVSSVIKQWKFPFNRNKKVSFFDEFVVVNQQMDTQVFSAHCTHLGCVISDVKGGKLVCPCHGSEFSLKGEALKGPAFKPLKKADFHFDDKERFIFVEPSNDKG